MVLAEHPDDQARGLRRMAVPQPVRVIAITGGKGGVGKTNVSANLAIALANRRREVLLLDADLGLANVDVLLGLHSSKDLSHLVSGDSTLDEILIEGPAGIKIIPAASGIARMASLSAAEYAGLIRAFNELSVPADFLLVDTAAGISPDVIMFARAAQDVIVVVCDEPASITDAYALIKVLHREHGVERFHILANMVRSEQEGQELYRKLATVSERFLDVVLQHLGTVPHDEDLRRSVQRQAAVVEAFPGSRAARSFNQLAARLCDWPIPSGASGHLEFFVERLVRAEMGQVSSG